MKPGYEPIILARKPLAGTVAANVLAYGTGGLNIDATRIKGTVPTTIQGQSSNQGDIYGADQRTLRQFTPADGGRWPANVVLDQAAANHLDQTSGETSYNPPATWRTAAAGDANDVYSPGVGKREAETVRGGFSDRGGASRFYYTAKADANERPRVDGIAHPTVKPLDLMRWLVRLVTPPGGVVVDPFAGSGTTVEAYIVEHFQCIAVEREADYLPLIRQRVTKPIEQVLW